MPQWTVDAPTRLAFDDVTALKVRAIAGSVAILATSETPALDITRISGQPLMVTHEDGLLTISYEDLTWDGLLEWLRPRNHSDGADRHGATGLPGPGRRGGGDRDACPASRRAPRSGASRARSRWTA